MTFHTNMTTEQMREACERQRKFDLHQARMWRDHYQKEIERLEAMDPLRLVSTAGTP